MCPTHKLQMMKVEKNENDVIEKRNKAKDKNIVETM